MCQHHRVCHAVQQQLKTNQKHRPLLPVSLELKCLCTHVLQMEDLKLAPDKDNCKHESSFGVSLVP